MNDTSPQSSTTEPDKGSEAERTKQVRIAGYTACVSAFFAWLTLVCVPLWPAAFGVAAVAAMVAVVCRFILKRV